MKNVYEVTFNVKLGSTWIGDATRAVVARDAEHAADRCKRSERNMLYDGKAPREVKIEGVKLLSKNVL